MRFSIFTVAAFAASVSAQASSDIAKFESDVGAYVTNTLLVDPTFLSVFAALETDTALLASLESAIDNPALLTEPAAQSSLFNALPSNVAPFFSSIASVESSIAIKDGVITAGASGATATGNTASATNTASSNFTAQTGVSTTSTSNGASTSTTTVPNLAGKMEISIVGGAVAGMVGLVMAL